MVFLDLRLPDISGFEVLEQLQADPDTQDMPIIVYTGQALDQEAQARLAASGVALLTKEAASRAQVLATLRQVCRASGVARRGWSRNSHEDPERR